MTYQGPLTRSLYWKFIEESRDESADVRVGEVGKSFFSNGCLLPPIFFPKKSGFCRRY